MKRLALVALILLVVVLLAACGAKEPAAVEPTPGEATGLDGATILQTKCTVCHTLDRVTAADYDDLGWENLIDRMRGKGADLTDDEATALAEYLSLQ